MSSLSELLKTRGLRLADVARSLNVNKATVTRWNGKAVPLDRLAAVEKATGIPAKELRPDLAELMGDAA
jgi:transcriptional regulator with XRE-family HTH domain